MKTERLHLVRLILPLIPETKCFGLKRRLFRWAGARVGSDVRICSSVRIYGGGELRIGRGTLIGHETLVVASADVCIGEFVDIAPQVFIGTGSHVISQNGKKRAGNGFSQNISIGDGAWICANAVVTAGVNIGDMALVAACSVVLSDIPKNVMYAGNPAVLKKEF